MRFLAALAVALLLASPCAAQDQHPTIVGSLEAALKDPTTWTPGAVRWAGKQLDWDSSYRLFALGAKEINPHYTISGLPRDTPVSHAVGNRRIIREVAATFGISVLHNAAAEFASRAALRHYPTHRRLIRVTHWAERIAFAAGATYVSSVANWRQWRTNVHRLERCAAGIRPC